ncbi:MULTISPECIES: TetR/AcrR family transcriptional regulator [Prauserella salsuginis group]|uniref:AcrR family transcriptional regulator n=2 Tax=Prauserella salsuginis group TaxID=2893672 RepID=A0A839XQN6_9PSEU|nr:MULTISPECIES: TetR/AcrR family transcriptional regulator [Prauserella salsuginis group]MBB3665530.1 AcrR family transcriptional regulator [Prauserella sediminis]MCR3718772.1 transcriptional regulator, TetR family [Prauserella flava]MCR3733342.1 transcriptional regulator, TetR family [Prauserella salsuginis]
MSKTGTEPAKRGRPRRGPDPERFAEIVEAAAAVILEKGYSATSIQDIADRIGILKGSLYHYVRSKEDFLYKIIKDVYDEAIADMRSVTEAERAPLEQLAAFVRAHVLFAAKHLVAYTIQLREFDRLSEARRAEIREGGDTYVVVLQRILEEGQREGVIDGAIDPRLASIMITGELNSMTRWYRPDGAKSAEQLADVYSGMIVSSVASEAAVSSAGGIEVLRAAFVQA